ncbi:MAG: D-alanine--D-alanine ligase [Sumerlaeia bacterium]
MVPQPKKILIICGGPSSEYVVSLTSARTVSHHLDRHRYHLRVCCIDEMGSWLMPDEVWSSETPPSRVEKLFDLLDMPDLCPRGFFVNRSLPDGLKKIQEWQPDLILPVMHGSFGEDGRLQGLLDFMGLPYVGSGVQSSSLCMDKRRTKDFVSAHGIRTARHMMLKAHSNTNLLEDQLAACGNLLHWPLIVKPNRGGSSLSSGLAHNDEELRGLVNRAFDADDEVLVEEFISGTEVTCGVLDLAESFGGRVVCPPTMIRPKMGSFFDFESKYRPGATEEITPAPFPDNINHRIQALSEKAHDVLGCHGMSRCDFIVNEDDIPIFLEVNTLPGMTSTSLLPQGAAACGINMTSMLTGLIEGRYERVIEQNARKMR